MSSTWTEPLRVVNLSWIDEMPTRPHSESRFRIAGPGCQLEPGEMFEICTMPRIAPARFRRTTWTRTEPPSSLLTKKRSQVEVVPMHSFGVSAELPLGCARDLWSAELCTLKVSLLSSI